ncbi:hypothetical protein [Sphingomonas sp.]|uniref:hypothetical protein n=1 Tax=Sphingomonas sp. TaxID=28214 RepID=UPI001B263446|nr:hypothetical protein [Sphingomonas sp.]MBO9712556.1 hypothetical protein [Sphingomonas sp.]
MLHRLLRIALAIVACAALPMLATPAAAQREVTNPPPVWSHAATATSFPETLGDFVRTTVYEYNAEGTDASVGYDLVRGGKKLASVTLYIYPPYTGGGCAAEYGAVKDGVAQSKAYQNVKLISEAPAPSPTGRTAGVADLATFTYDFGFGGGQSRPVRSEAYAFCAAHGAWIVSYRATWPSDIDVSQDVAQLFRAIDWPDTLDNR